MAQNTARKNARALVPQRAGGQDGLGWWVEQYFQHAVTTSPASQRVQRRDLGLFLRYLQAEEGTDQRLAWTPRLARAFQQHLRQTLTPEGRRAWSDKTIQRILAHLKTFATWVHMHQPFPLGHPMAAIKLPALGTGLEVDRALTAAERRRLLDAADLLLAIGGRSKDRKRYKTGERPRRTGYRPYRNRAVVYTLIETGMRRAAVTHLDLAQVDLAGRRLTVVEKGGGHPYVSDQSGGSTDYPGLYGARARPGRGAVALTGSVPDGRHRAPGHGAAHCGGGEYGLEYRLSRRAGAGADAA
jgi:integrase